LIFGLATETSLIAKFFSSKPLQILGKSSYVFYLIHVGIFYLVVDKLFGNLLVSFLLLNVFAVLLYYFVEKPLNCYFKQFFDSQVNK
jgi:peptidoglycan/LPS O-acetylase OafA/YrhL